MVNFLLQKTPKEDYLFFPSLVSMKIEDDGLTILTRRNFEKENQNLEDSSITWEKYHIDNSHPQTSHIIVPNWMGVFHEGVFDWLDSHGVTLSFMHKDFSLGNSFIPRPMKSNNISLKRLQYGMTWERSYPFLKKILERKISGESENLSNMGLESVATRLITVMKSLPVDTSLASQLEVMSIEGLASGLYWNELKTFKIHWNLDKGEKLPTNRFATVGERAGLQGRNGRYAISPFHAILNYVGGLAITRLRIAVKGMGLDGDVGFFHADDEYRESLLYDLVEGLRPIYEGKLLNMYIYHNENIPKGNRKRRGHGMTIPGLRLKDFTYFRDTGRVVLGKDLRVNLLQIFDGDLMLRSKDVVAEYRGYLENEEH